MASFLRFASRSAKSVPIIAGAYAINSTTTASRCDAPPATDNEAAKLVEASVVPVKTAATQKTAGMKPDEEGDYHKMFPKRQLWQPKLEYPLWDNNWDDREPESTGDKEQDRKRQREIRRNGVTRHIILVRHGQYDETHKEDEKRVLTPLGREQADLTGKRLAAIIAGAEGNFGPCNVRVLAVSNLARAKETANIIAEHLPNVRRSEPDPNLNEGRPCHYIPGTKANDKLVKTTDEGHARIEAGFKELFHRDTGESEERKGDEPVEGTEPLGEKHEFEVVVCHANVIRYFLMRALQLPPEAWLRYCPFNCSLTYVTIRPTGTVSCRMFGDIGHIPYGKSTFSSHEGFNW